MATIARSSSTSSGARWACSRSALEQLRDLGVAWPGPPSHRLPRARPSWAAGPARRCPRRGRARTARSAAPPRPAGWRARAATRGRRGPAPGTSSRGRRRRRSAGPAPPAPPRAAAGSTVARTSTTMSPARRPSLELGPQAVGDQARLGAAPRLVAALREAELAAPLVPALRGRDQQLDVRRARGRVEREQPQRPVLVHRDLLAARLQRREALAELGREGGVEDVEQLLPGAEVDRQPAHLARAAAAVGAVAEDRSRPRAGSGRSTGTRRRPRTGCRARAPAGSRAGPRSCPGTRRS